MNMQQTLPDCYCMPNMQSLTSGILWILSVRTYTIFSKMTETTESVVSVILEKLWTFQRQVNIPFYLLVREL